MDIINNLFYRKDSWINTIVSTTIDCACKLVSKKSLLIFAGLSLIGLFKYCTPSANSSRFLFVKKIDPAGYPAVGETAHKWFKINNQETIYRGIYKFCNNSDLRSSPDHEVYVCKDENGIEQGIMTLGKGSEIVEITFIATHPRNIPSPQNLHTNRVKGVGSALVHYAERLALENEKEGVKVHPVPKSIPFYEKTHFAQSGGNWIKTKERIVYETMLRVCLRFPLLSTFGNYFGFPSPQKMGAIVTNNMLPSFSEVQKCLQDPTARLKWKMTTSL